MEAARHEPSADSLTVAPVEVAADETLAGPEWWERLASRWLDWRQRHQQLAERWAQVRAVALWLALAGLLVVFVLFPEFRAGLRVWVWLYGLLVAWFFVARTKTVAWRLLARVFGTAVWWSVIIAVISMWLASRAGGVRGDGPGTVIAGMTEESLKLVPLAALALAAPSRVRRLAVVDWLLLGLACGLGFQAFEELARRTSAAVVRPGLLDVLDRLLGSASGSQAPQYGWSLLAGGWNTRLASYAGHHVLTALVAVSVGVGVAAWRRGARLAAQREGRGQGLAGARRGRAPGDVVAGRGRPCRVQRHREHQQPSVGTGRRHAATAAGHLGPHGPWVRPRLAAAGPATGGAAGRRPPPATRRSLVVDL